MDMAKFSVTNHHRACTAYAPKHGPQALVNCIVEEVGEIAATVSGWTGEKKRKAHLTREDTAKEIADAVTYLDLLCTECGYNLWTVLQDRFNEVSKRTGYETQV